ncbi:MAG: radical SAM protein [Bacteroidetes bacterium]|nr:radical SAM protein [Bacteroidota bacterium]
MRFIPEIPLKFERFPQGYINDINGWAFDKNTIESNKGKLLTLDIDFGDYCSLNCPHCFRYKNTIDNVQHELNIKDLQKLILDAKKLGLQSVKFLGKGEPFENKDFLDFLRFLKSVEVIPLIFTKGHVLGSDAMVTKYFKGYGHITSESLIKELDELNCSIMLGFNSFDDEIQAKMVGRNTDYIHVRNNALKLMVKQGFNNSIPTRIALAINPVTIWNIGECLEMYKWGRLRNIYCIVTPTMISGRAKDKMWVKITPADEKMIELYQKIYEFNIETGLQTIEQIEKEGISAYAGGHPCNQVSTGLYVSLNGIVLSCPGSEENVEGNIWKTDLETIWNHSENIHRTGTFNCGCIAKDGKSIPENFYKQVEYNLNLKYGTYSTI